MRVNAEFDQQAVIRLGDRKWVPSPAGGVEWCMLVRIGDEVARATSLVWFAANSSFPTHSQGGSEEFFVLEGTFSDEGCLIYLETGHLAEIKAPVVT